jgi:hypothetical protein
MGDRAGQGGVESVYESVGICGMYKLRRSWLCRDVVERARFAAVTYNLPVSMLIYTPVSVEPSSDI